jgi:hypothetical protein
MRMPRLPVGAASPRALIELAALIRDRLAELGRWARPERTRQAATVIVAAAAPFAPNPYARARLLRQMHASGLLTERETAQATELLRVAP